MSTLASLLPKGWQELPGLSLSTVLHVASWGFLTSQQSWVVALLTSWLVSARLLLTLTQRSVNIPPATLFWSTRQVTGQPRLKGSGVEEGLRIHLSMRGGRICSLAGLLSHTVFLSFIYLFIFLAKPQDEPKNCCFQIVVLENSWETLGLQGEQTSQSERKSTLNIHWHAAVHGVTKSQTRLSS